MWPAETEVMVSQLCLMCGSTLNCQTLCLGARPRYNLALDENEKKPTNQQTKLLIATIVLFHTHPPPPGLISDN